MTPPNLPGYYKGHIVSTVTYLVVAAPGRAAAAAAAATGDMAGVS